MQDPPANPERGPRVSHSHAAAFNRAVVDEHRGFRAKADVRQQLEDVFRLVFPVDPPAGEVLPPQLHVFDSKPCFVGEFAEIDFMAVRCLAKHADIRAGAKYIVFAGLHDDRAYFRMLKTQPLYSSFSSISTARS